MCSIKCQWTERTALTICSFRLSTVTFQFISKDTSFAKHYWPKISKTAKLPRKLDSLKRKANTGWFVSTNFDFTHHKCGMQLFWKHEYWRQTAETNYGWSSINRYGRILDLDKDLQTSYARFGVSHHSLFMYTSPIALLGNRVYLAKVAKSSDIFAWL